MASERKTVFVIEDEDKATKMFTDKMRVSPGDICAGLDGVAIIYQTEPVGYLGLIKALEIDSPAA